MLRHLSIPILAMTSVACASDRTAIAGSLADSLAASAVSIEGSDARATIEGGAFRLDPIEGDTVELRFHDGEDEVGRMTLAGFRGSEELTLQSIWFEDGEAFPAAVDLNSDTPFLVNGLRMAAAGALPRTVDAAGVVLAVTDIGDAMIVRPEEMELPDLKVLLTPGSSVRDVEGEEFDADEIAQGNSVRVSGAPMGDYIIATGVVVSTGPSDSLDGASSGSEFDLDDAPDVQPATEGRNEPANSNGRDDNGGNLERGKGNSGGRGQGEARGKGRD